MYAKIGYPEVKDARWIVQSQQIIDFPVTVQGIDISHEILYKNIVVLKGETTRKKPIHMVGDIVKIPKGVIELHKELFMTAGIFFVNGIPFLFC